MDHQKDEIIPFHLFDGFILIDAEVNEWKGKFLLDTGSPFDFFLNNEKIELDTSNIIGEGAASSGQKIVVHKSSELLLIKIEGFSEKISIKENFHTQLNFVGDALGVNIIGFLGYGFLKDYEFSIDYDKQLLTLISIDAVGNTISNKKDVLFSDRTTIHFHNNNHINIPEVNVEICNQIIPAYFDTGSQGSISLSEQLKDALILKNVISDSHGFHYGIKQDSITTIQIKSISIQGNQLGAIDNLLFEKGASQLTLGYSFLKNYISVWNYKKRTIELIRK